MSLFPKTPGRASVFEDSRKKRNERTIGLPVLKLQARSTANKELLLKMTWDLYINLYSKYKCKEKRNYSNSTQIYVTLMFILSSSAVNCAFSLCEMFVSF